MFRPAFPLNKFMRSHEEKPLKLKNLDEWKYHSPEFRFKCGHASQVELRNKPFSKEEIAKIKEKIENSLCPACTGETKFYVDRGE